MSLNGCWLYGPYYPAGRTPPYSFFALSGNWGIRYFYPARSTICFGAGDTAVFTVKHALFLYTISPQVLLEYVII
jgi:hypothetical protein